ITGIALVCNRLEPGSRNWTAQPGSAAAAVALDRVGQAGDQPAAGVLHEMERIRTAVTEVRADDEIVVGPDTGESSIDTHFGIDRSFIEPFGGGGDLRDEGVERARANGELAVLFGRNERPQLRVRDGTDRSGITCAHRIEE